MEQKLHPFFFLLGIKMKKAQAGLQILLAVIVSIFVIGLLVMIYSLMSGALVETDSLYLTTNGTTLGESLTTVDSNVGENLTVNLQRSSECEIINITNASDYTLIDSGNYTQSNCNLKSSGGNIFNNTNWNVSYRWSYLSAGEAIDVINETQVGIGTTTTWFPIMIVITAMIVLILLTVIIITAIRGSGLISEKGNNKREGGNTGTA